MATYFFDTSALIKYYHTERGSNRVTQLFQAPGAEVLISRLGVTEVHSSLAKKVRQGDLSKEDFMDVLHNGFFQDIRAGRIRVTRMTERVYQGAESLIRDFGPTQDRLKALDALHLASAMAVREQQGLDALVASDSALCSVAQLEGVQVINPDLPQ